MVRKILGFMVLHGLLGASTFDSGANIGMTDSDSLHACIKTQATKQDINAYMRWSFASISIRPELQGLTQLNRAQKQVITKNAADALFQLISVRCNKELRKMVQKGDIDQVPSDIVTALDDWDTREKYYNISSEVPVSFWQPLLKKLQTVKTFTPSSQSDYQYSLGICMDANATGQTYKDYMRWVFLALPKDTLFDGIIEVSEAQKNKVADQARKSLFRLVTRNCKDEFARVKQQKELGKLPEMAETYTGIVVFHLLNQYGNDVEDVDLELWEGLKNRLKSI